jgi:hypothetical protein
MSIPPNPNSPIGYSTPAPLLLVLVVLYIVPEGDWESYWRGATSSTPFSVCMDKSYDQEKPYKKNVTA